MYISIIQEHEVKEILIKVYHLINNCFQGIGNIFFPVRKAHYEMGVFQTIWFLSKLCISALKTYRSKKYSWKKNKNQFHFTSGQWDSVKNINSSSILQSYLWSVRSEYKCKLYFETAAGLHLWLSFPFENDPI